MNPLPDYWLAVLHKRLMGQIVLNTTSSSRGLRVYAHCAVGRGVGLSFLNLDETRAINLTLPAALAQLPSRLAYSRARAARACLRARSASLYGPTPSCPRVQSSASLKACAKQRELER